MLDPTATSAVVGTEVKQPAVAELPATAVVYNAFISYSHAADGALAPALRDGLQRFATPWRVFHRINPVRSLRIFQDQASLSANPALWPTIENALSSADWFILLASPEAAASPWVDKEVEFWRENRSVERLLIVQTDGEITWNTAANDFDWTRTTALPKRLETTFRYEPRWIDARWAHSAAHASLRDPRFRDLVAELAAPLRGVPKDELIGEDIRQHRRLNRWRNAAFSALSLLLVGALTAAAIAVWQRDLAVTQRNEALLATSRARAALSIQKTEAHDAKAGLDLALGALKLGNTDLPITPEAENAMYMAVLNLREKFILRHETKVEWAILSADSQRVVTPEGLWDAKTGNPIIKFPPLPGRVASATVSAAFSHDGRLITGGYEGELQLRNGVTGQIDALIQGHAAKVSALSFSPDGNLIVSAGMDNVVHLWSAMPFSLIRSFKGHEGAISALSFSSNADRLLTTSWDGSARIWNIASGEALVLHGHSGPINYGRFSPDDTVVVTISDDATARLWDPQTGELLNVLEGHSEPVTAVDFSPDSSLLVTGSESGSSIVWNEWQQPLATMRGHAGPVTSTKFSADGERILTSSWDGTTQIWSINGAHLLTLYGHTGRVQTSAFSANAQLVLTASDDKTARIWNATFGLSQSVLRHRYEVSNPRFSPDGRRILTNGVVGDLLSSVEDGKPIAILAHADSFSADGARVVGWRGNEGMLWESETGKLITVLTGHSAPIISAALSGDGRQALTSSEDKTARLWDAATGAPFAVFEGHSGKVNVARFSPDGLTVSTASSDCTVRLWDVRSSLPKNMLNACKGKGEVTAIEFSSDGQRLASIQWDEDWDNKTIALWSLPHTNILARVKGHAFQFSPDGSLLATVSSNRIVKLFDTQTGKDAGAFDGLSVHNSKLAFTPDGTRLISFGTHGLITHRDADIRRDNSLVLWDVKKGNQTAVLMGHQDKITSAAFSTDSRLVLTGSEDGTARLWDAITGQLLCVLRGHGKGVLGTAFGPGGEVVATTSRDTTARLWRLPPLGQPLMDLVNGLVDTASREKQREIQ